MYLLTAINNTYNRKYHYTGTLQEMLEIIEQLDKTRSNYTFTLGKI